MPGDIITFDFDNSERYNDHIGIYVAPANAECTKIICIEGNTGGGKSNKNGVWKKIRNAGSINGFGQLTTLNDLQTGGGNTGGQSTDGELVLTGTVARNN